jgi:hypothetical protein
MPSGSGATGNLAVGISTPLYRVDIGGSLRLTGALVLDDATSNVIQHRAGTDVNTLVTVGHGGFDHNGYLRIGGANVATQSWVQSQGYITPNSTVSGWIAFQASTQGTTIIRAVQQDTTSGYYLFQGITGSTEMFRVDRLGGAYFAGNVGIGTASPNRKLHVIGDAWINRPSNKVDNNGATEFGARVEFNNAFTAGSTGYAVFNYPSSSVFRIYGDYDGNIGGVQPDLQLGLGYLTVKSAGGTAGYVGIGTASPDRLFTIAPASGDAYINLKRPVAASTQATLEFNTAGTNDWLIRTDDASANLKFYSYGTSGYPLILSKSTGAATFSSSITCTSLTETSTIKVKENIVSIDSALDQVEKLQAVSYNRKGSSVKEIGLIAEAVEEVYPEFVQYDQNGEPVGLNYSRLTAVLIESVKELKNRIQELEKRN